MALVKKIVWDNRKVGWNSETVCSVRVGGVMFLQLNTYGSSDREVKGQSSQALTFDRESGICLRDMLLTLYPLEGTDSTQNHNTTPNT